MANAFSHKRRQFMEVIPMTWHRMVQFHNKWWYAEQAYTFLNGYSKNFEAYFGCDPTFTLKDYNHNMRNGRRYGPRRSDFTEWLVRL